MTMPATLERPNSVEELDRAANAFIPLVTLFRHPQDVVSDTLLDNADKRAILASWASDASAVANRPDLRWLPGTSEPVALDDVLESLIRLD